MARRRHSTVGRRLPWLVLQGTLFLPAALGALAALGSDPVVAVVVSLTLTLWVLIAVTRNGVRLWRADPAEADGGTIVRLGASAAWFVLLSSGPLLSGDGSSRLFGCAIAVLAALLLVLTAREVERVRRARAFAPDAARA